MNLKQLVVALGATAFAATANATLVSGSSLQDGLDALTVGGDFLNVNDDQYTPDEKWAVTSTGLSAARMLFEVAGFATTSTFGVYDVTDSSKRLELFSGPDCGTADGCSSAESRAILDVSGTTFENVLDGTSMVFGSSVFGYYIDSSSSAGGGLFYSESALNSGVADAAHEGTTDHMIAFAGDGSLTLDIDGPGTLFGDTTFSAGEYILAFEDLEYPSSDYDFSDMVIIVESVEAIPEPMSIALLGIGLLGMGWTRRKA